MDKNKTDHLSQSNHNQNNSTPDPPSNKPLPSSGSKFPATTLSHLPSTLDLSTDDDEEEERDYPDANTAVASLHPLDMNLNMDPTTPSGHRRRRSSTKTSQDAGRLGTHLMRPRNSKRKTSNILEGDEEGRFSQDDSMSPNDDVLDRMSEGDDEIFDDEETGLTAADKGKRRGRRRRNTLLSERIVATDVKITAEEQRAADRNVFRQSLINCLLIGLWYFFSLTISLYNKWMFDKDHLNFPFPLFTTCTHMLVQFCLASLVLFFMPRFRPRHDSISNPRDTHPADEDRELFEAESKKPLMTHKFYFTRIGPCGMATGLDIGLGNFSLRFITLTFYTMCKSSSLAFVLLFAFLFRLEKPSLSLVGIIVTMTVGVLLMVAGEVDTFSAIGFILVISAAFFSGFRWGLTQILLLRNPATSNPFSSIFYLAPVMFTTLLIIAIPIEGFPKLLEGIAALIESKGRFLGPATLLFPGVIAFFMTASEFALLQRTSVVTLSIAGIFKEVVTITAAGLKFHDPLTPMNIVGLFVTMGAIAAYNYIKIKGMRDGARTEVHKRMESTNIINIDHDGSDADGEDEYGQESGIVSAHTIDDTGVSSPALHMERTSLTPLNTAGLGGSHSRQNSIVTAVDDPERVGFLKQDSSD